MSARRKSIAILAIATVLALACWWLVDRHAVAGHAPPAQHAQRSSPAVADPAAARTSIRASNIAAPDPDPDAAARQSDCMHDRRAQLQHRRAQLGSPATPDAAIEYAFLTSLSAPDMAPGETARELTAASERWPANVELAWLAAHHCPRAACASAWRHLAALEPDNAAVWLMAMADTTRAHDQAGYEQALQRAGAARVYDPHDGLVFLHARAVLAALPVPERCRTPGQLASLRQELGRTPTADDWADLESVNTEAALGGADHGGLQGCRATAQPSGTRRQDCIALLSLVASGRTLGDQALALHMLLALEPDAAGTSQLRERYRRVRWLIRQTRLARGIPPGALIQQWTQGEVATLQARAIAEGRWPPPADWLPDDLR